MKGYVVFLYDAADDRPRALAAKAGADLDQILGPRRPIAEGLDVWVSDDLDVTQIPGGACVGQVFGGVRYDGAESSAKAAGRLCQQGWGRFVAVWRDGSVFRSPMGFLDAFTWMRDGLQVAASIAPPCLDQTLPSTAVVDEAVVARFLRREPEGFGLCPIRDVHTVSPGALWRAGRQDQLWRWERFCTPGGGSDADPERLRHVVDTSIEAWAGRFPQMGCELSGGLDSSIVAASLSQAGARPRFWINYHEATRGADERTYVRALAQAHGLTVDYAAKTSERFDLDDLEAAAHGLRPASAGLDASADADMAARLTNSGAQAAFGGQGGDAVFFQMPSPLIGADPLFGVGRRDVVRLWADLARWQGSTAWSVMRRSLLGRLGLANPPRMANPPLTEHARRWRPSAPTPTVAPAKTLQAEALHNSQVFFGPCRRGAAAALIHPLLSQPIVEHCLSIPASVLTGGTRDRLLVRQAFTPVLPRVIAERRSKGLLSSYYARHVADNAQVLGDYLVDGRLTAMGLLDARCVKAMLEPEQMIQRADLSVLLTCALMEAWVRVWEARLAQAVAH